MKTLINIVPWGINLQYDETAEYPFILNWQDDCSMVWKSARYETRDEAIGELANYLMNPDNVYSMEDQPEDLQDAFRIAGIPTEWRVEDTDARFATWTFLYHTLDAIATTVLYHEA